MQELIANLHVHTQFSDGSKTHQEVINDAIDANLDVLFFTDHNTFTNNIEGYHTKSNKKLLVIMGEEVHDPTAFPQKNHLLALGAGKPLSQFSYNRKKLFSEIRSTGGVSVIAHPYDPELIAFNEPDISWMDKVSQNFDSVEIWNGFSELKIRVKKKWQAYFFAFFPKFLPLCPPKESVAVWEEFLMGGKKITAMGGSDAHALKFSAGFLNKVVFPYTYHFQTINTHIIIPKLLSGNYFEDKAKVLSAIKNGRVFIANDSIHTSSGFKFYARNGDRVINMGESCKYKEGMMLYFNLPAQADCHLFQNGNNVFRNQKTESYSWKIPSPGIYRLECHKYSRFMNRTWIFSNPIYLT